MSTSKRKPHNHLAGYQFERRFRDGHLVCYEASKQGIDADNRWVLVFERPESKESAIGPSYTSLKKARADMKLFVDGDMEDYCWGVE